MTTTNDKTPGLKDATLADVGSEPAGLRSLLLALPGVRDRMVREMAHEHGFDSEPATAEQVARAEAPPKGLAGKALAVYIVTGERLKAQTAKAQSKRTTAKAEASAAARTPGGPREGGALAAALAVLKGAQNPLTPQEIYDRAQKRGLAGGLKGKTPVATMAAQLATANKKGQYVERPAPGRYRLRKG